MEYDKLEAAGHEITLLEGISLGITTYFCENCGAIIKMQDGEIVLFHVAKTSTGTREKCSGDGNVCVVTLEQKLRALNEAFMERLRTI